MHSSSARSSGLMSKPTTWIRSPTPASRSAFAAAHGSPPHVSLPSLIRITMLSCPGPAGKSFAASRSAYSIGVLPRARSPSTLDLIAASSTPLRGTSSAVSLQPTAGSSRSPVRCP